MAARRGKLADFFASAVQYLAEWQMRKAKDGEYPTRNEMVDSLLNFRTAMSISPTPVGVLVCKHCLRRDMLEKR